MERILTLGDTKIAYDYAGCGPPLLLVHGTSGDRSGWNDIRPFLEVQFTVYAMDRRGRHGSVDHGKYSIEREYEDVAKLVDSISKDSDNQLVHLIGHSFGAICSLGASVLTDNISSLVLYDTPPLNFIEFIPQALMDNLQKLHEDGDDEGLLCAFYQDICAAPPEWIESERSLPGWPEKVAFAHTIFREVNSSIPLSKFDSGLISQLELPVLLLVGENSHPIYSLAAKQYQGWLQNSTTVMLPGQGHLATKEAPDLLASEITAFIAGLQKVRMIEQLSQ
jgi:pimeloyl-ACP methyl ester carboxylesterase